MRGANRAIVAIAMIAAGVPGAAFASVQLVGDNIIAGQC